MGTNDSDAGNGRGDSMRIEKSIHMDGYVTVHVDTDELDCGQRKLPYPTCIGLVNATTGKTKVWTPAAYKPRGYKAAAQRMLDDVLAKLKAGVL